MPSNKHFRFFAPYYDKIIKNNDNIEFTKYAELPYAGRILEIGGGTGRILSEINDLVDQVVNVDLTIEMLNIAREKGIASICSLGEQLPFEDKSFGRILIIDSIHHINHQEMVISEAMRVMADDGLALIVEPTYHKFSGFLVRVFEKVLFMQSNFLKDEALKKMIQKYFDNISLHHHNGNSWFVVRKSS